MPDRVRGVILSNELLDAFPVERWCWSAAQQRWVEQGVCWKDGRFDWMALPTFAPPEWILPEELQSVLPEGFVRERSPAAVAWWARAAAALQHGCLITFDYGLEAEEFLTPGRSAGTLRAYHRHRVSDDLLSSPGEVDLTAHVDFSAVAEAARQEGLTPWYRERQSRFLMRILESTQRRPGGFPDWSSQRVRAFQTLTHPEHFGRSFRVLAQGRGASPWSRA
jgi:SAM-dependent MidA family methyltransferase